MAKKKLLDASEEERVKALACQKAYEKWQRCSAAVEEASSTLAECNREQRVKEERKGYIGGHSQDHEGVAEDFTQKIYATDNEEEETLAQKTKKNTCYSAQQLLVPHKTVVCPNSCVQLQAISMPAPLSKCVQL